MKQTRLQGQKAWTHVDVATIGMSQWCCALGMHQQLLPDEIPCRRAPPRYPRSGPAGMDIHLQLQPALGHSNFTPSHMGDALNASA